MDSIDLNCDMGEGVGDKKVGDDVAMLDIVTSANVACGFHGGDPMIMHRVISRARTKGVRVGAHPGFYDLHGFGRQAIAGQSSEAISQQLLYQIGAITMVARAVGHPISHIKAHGALANLAGGDKFYASAVVAAVRHADPALALVVMPGSVLEQLAAAAGLRLVREVYADRAYDETGRLVARSEPGAVITDAAQAADRVMEMIDVQAVTSLSGRKIPVAIDTVCVHGDTPGAVKMAGLIRRRLENAGIALKAF